MRARTIAFVVGLAYIGTTPDVTAVRRRSAVDAIRVPLGLDLYIPTPSENPMTSAKIDLGRRLFFDPRLSADGRTSCGTCHQPERSFTDGRTASRGVFGRVGRRNVPSILNRGYGRTMFWDGRAESLETQVRLAAEGTTDLGLPLEESLPRIAADPAYASPFRAAFGDTQWTSDRIAKTIATFVRAQVSGNSTYDRFIGGAPTALTPDARRGLELFVGRAGCSRCHSGPLLSDEEFHNTGVSWGHDLGRSGVSGAAADRGRFKTPSLRNVALTAPYMHDGSIETLGGVIDFYDRGAGRNPNLDDRMRPLALSPEERQAFVAFLRALTGSADTTPDSRDPANRLHGLGRRGQ